MAAEESDRVLTLKERMARLNAAQVGLNPRESGQNGTRQMAPVPLRKQKSFNVPAENTVSTAAQPAIANTPRGPPPLPSRKAPPPLPTRKKSEVALNGNNGTARVVASRTKSQDQETRVKAPAWGECELPALPPKAAANSRKSSFAERPAYERKASVSSLASTMTTMSNGSRQTLPPPLPTRKSQDSVKTSDALPRKMPPLPTSEVLEKAKQAAFSRGAPEIAKQDTTPSSILSKQGPSVSEKPFDVTSVRDIAPVIPTATRPDLSSIQATKPKVKAVSPSAIETSGCLICRDFSAPDRQARMYPRQQVKSLQSLAQSLTIPFSSDTDKARAIFTWLHHNIDYNTEAFFSGNIKSSTPSSTLDSGLAVCEGYAALFTNLATYAGLQSMVVSGHGKGFGFSALPLGAPLPPYEGNHAWNVVKIDEGWKLIDSCWGAGAVEGAGMPYMRRFAPERFTQSNEEFGLDHFPNNRDHFFLTNGRALEWSDYIQRNSTQWPYQFEPLTVFTNATTDYSIGKQTFQPPYRKIEVRKSGSIRFQFGLFCSHWTLERHSKQGPPPVFILSIGGVDGRDKKFVPFEHFQPDGQNGGDMWYLDVQARELGAPGETLTLFAVTNFGNMQNARGLSVQQFKDGIGRTAMGFTGVAAWELI